MRPFLSLHFNPAFRGRNYPGSTSVTISLWRRFCFCRSLNHRNDWDPQPTQASHQAINHIVVDHHQRGHFPAKPALFLLQRYNRPPSLPMFRDLTWPLFWELPKHFKKKILGWVEFFRRLTLIAGPFLSEPDLSQMNQAINLNMTILTGLSILATRPLPCNLLSISTRNAIWTISWAALSWVCWCRGCLDWLCFR